MNWRDRDLIWTDDRAEASLVAIVSAAGLSLMPSGAWLDSQGHSTLRAYLSRSGVRYWANRIGIGLSARQQSKAKRNDGSASIRARPTSKVHRRGGCGSRGSLVYSEHDREITCELCGGSAFTLGWGPA